MKLPGFSTSVDPILTSTLVRVTPWIVFFFLANLTILLSVFFSYAVATHDSAVLFVEREQFTNDAHAALTDTVDVGSCGSFLEYLQTLPGTLELNDASVGPILLSRVVTEAS